MAIKTTCLGCDKKQKQFCRGHSIAKNSHICRLVQKHDFKTANEKLIGG